MPALSLHYLAFCSVSDSAEKVWDPRLSLHLVQQSKNMCYQYVCCKCTFFLLQELLQKAFSHCSRGFCPKAFCSKHESCSSRNLLSATDERQSFDHFCVNAVLPRTQIFLWAQLVKMLRKSGSPGVPGVYMWRHGVRRLQQ